MKATIIQRGAPLLITTMLAAAPAWAQQSGTTPNNSSRGTLALSAPADRATPVPDAGAGQKRTADDMFRTYADARSRRPTSAN